MIQVPLWEWGGVDLNDTVLDKSFGSDEFVVWSVVNNVQNSGLSGYWFWGPVEVSFLESEGSELIVTSSDSNSSNSCLIVDKLSVRNWSSLLESSLLFMNWHSATSQSSFMSWISWNTHFLIITKIIFINFFYFKVFLIISI